MSFPLLHLRNWAAYSFSMILLFSLFFNFAVLARLSQTPDPSRFPDPQAAAGVSKLNTTEVSELQAEAQKGDVAAQVKLGKAYLHGDGVSKNDELAAKWFRKAADQGDATAENQLGNMFRLGVGVARDKEEALRWYEKAALHGSPEGMFNLGTCYYNGDGVGSNEFTAYMWFLVAQHAGNPMGDDAAKRSASTMSKSDSATAFMKIADMYDRGEQLPKDDVEAMFWLRKAAEISSPGKVRLAGHLLMRPNVSGEYAEALNLCKEAAKDYNPGAFCVASIYRKGLGVNTDPTEAIKWYQKAVASSNGLAMLALAEMYSTGEGTKIDRASAMLWLFRASLMRMPAAHQKAAELLKQLDKSEMKQFEKKLRDQHFDPKKVLAELRVSSPS